MSNRPYEAQIEMCNKVFVYGTLRNKESRGHALPGDFIMDKMILRGALYNLGGFPALWEDSSMDTIAVIGEIYTATPDRLAMLDHIEGHPRFYIRALRKTEQGNLCWVYLISSSKYVANASVITSGDWLNREDTRHAQ